MNRRQIRKETRVEVNIPLSVKEICIHDRIINLNKTLPMNTVNLSSNGVLLHSVLNIPQSLKLYLNLNIGSESIFCFADIVRKEVRGDGYYYGCKITVKSDVDKDKIRKYVFGRQIMNARRKLYS